MNAAPATSAPEKPLQLIFDGDQLIADTQGFSMSSAFEVITSHSRRQHAPAFSLDGLLGINRTTLYNRMESCAEEL